LVKPRELEALLARDAMIVRDSVGVRVNPITRHFSLTPRLWVNYMLCATRHNP
jgi:2-polyprenyl-3-methyl-5-hydroxy-6-metoxy-1,4-benzoquinol methylase